MNPAFWLGHNYRVASILANEYQGMNDAFWIGLWSGRDHKVLDDACDKLAELFRGGF